MPKVEMGWPHSSEGRRKVVETSVGLGAAGGAPEVGKTSLEMGRRASSVQSEQGRALAESCTRPDQMVGLGGRVYCKALVTRCDI